MTVRNTIPGSGRGRAPGVPPLYNGDRLTQREFHRRYEAMPADCQAELINGVVYMASPLRRPHGRASVSLGAVLGTYAAATPGVEALDNTTLILGEDAEPQPDLMLRLDEAHGGRSRIDENEYVVGPPELIIEIAHSSEAVDLHDKKADYRSAGVQEYLVLCLHERRLAAFDLAGNREAGPDADGVFRSRAFPGLWIDSAAAVSGDGAALLQTARKGLGSPEHAEFVKRLKRAKAR